MSAFYASGVTVADAHTPSARRTHAAEVPVHSVSVRIEPIYLFRTSVGVGYQRIVQLKGRLHLSMYAGANYYPFTPKAEQYNFKLALVSEVGLGYRYTHYFPRVLYRHDNIIGYDDQAQRMFYEMTVGILFDPLSFRFKHIGLSFCSIGFAVFSLDYQSESQKTRVAIFDGAPMHDFARFALLAKWFELQILW